MDIIYAAPHATLMNRRMKILVISFIGFQVLACVVHKILDFLPDTTNDIILLNLALFAAVLQYAILFIVIMIANEVTPFVYDYFEI